MKSGEFIRDNDFVIREFLPPKAVLTSKLSELLSLEYEKNHKGIERKSSLIVSHKAVSALIGIFRKASSQPELFCNSILFGSQNDQVRIYYLTENAINMIGKSHTFKEFLTNISTEIVLDRGIDELMFSYIRNVLNETT